MPKIICPFHEDTNPSCEIYEDGYHCFVCDASGPLSALGPEFRDIKAPPKLPPTDLPSELARIKLLPFAPVRGLQLPVDTNSYYVLWPGDTYFKRRLFFPGEGPKYLCPRGHAKPPFWAHHDSKNSSLAVVEGELNALSLERVLSGWDILSPGGVGDFNEKLLPMLRGYKRFVLILDKDKPGLDAGKRMKEMLVRMTPHVDLFLVAPDLNDQLVNGTLEKEVKSWHLDMPTRV